MTEAHFANTTSAQGPSMHQPPWRFSENSSMAMFSLAKMSRAMLYVLSQFPLKLTTGQRTITTKVAHEITQDTVIYPWIKLII